VEADQFQIHHYLSSISLLQAVPEAVLGMVVEEEEEVFSQGASLLSKEFHIQQQWVEAVQHTMRDRWAMDQAAGEASAETRQ
jgi:hypothetical protein